ncbi:hypothetical protein [Companilactobacillus nodensis]|uniref:Uncharacterized protein n=1 Tax=Companilactobacillus nodensis DSM 19682 = JCM 14932 = NBRC 107160 TaxID=1423775 RepID=A0A0R1KLB2_9LACO|nr:hypothetical protein [Companilactobacillus nodensis]KRK79975.1 hypothetical protein FD03_GL000151 [Companilactobacillus nodensis DSM 19682 = JCM 14932 = NBRC 107160]
MQVKQSRLNNTIAKTIITNTATFIDRNFDFKLGEVNTHLKQMPLKQLDIFANQSFQKQYSIIVTMVNDEQFHGKLIKRINQNKYILKINNSFFKIVQLEQIKSINLV